MTDFRAEGTIMGPAGLTAVFGMGTGVAPPAWSPGNRPGGGQARPGVDGSVVRSRRDAAILEFKTSSAPRTASEAD